MTYNEFLKTYEELSATNQGDVLTNSRVKAFDYDKITQGKFCSADALKINENEIIFIEFKNCPTKYKRGNEAKLRTDNLKYNVKLKAIESVFSLGSLLYDNGIIDHIKDVYDINMKYIVVYSSDKNKELYDREINIAIRNRYEAKAIFDLERYKGIIFKQVLTISDKKFNDMLEKNVI